jgi:hypothetical protein
MHHPVRVDFARGPDADAFDAFLGGRGFRTRRDGATLEVEGAELDSLDEQVERALTAWLAAHDRDLVPVRTGPHRVALGPPAG